MKKPPFSVERHRQRGLSAQMAEGLRNAILTGFYKEGEVLPKILEWAEMLGVSIRVPEAAIAALVREGLVVTHPGVGCVVRPRAASIWRGHVLLVMPDSTMVYTSNVMAERIRSALSQSGWLVSQIDVPRLRDGHYDLTRLEFALKHPVELAIVLASRRPIEEFLSRAGVDFITYGEVPCLEPHCAGRIRLDIEAALPDFVRHCVATGVRRVVQVSKQDSPNAADALRTAGIEVECWRLPEPDGLRPEAVQRAALEAFKARLAGGRSRLPDLFFINDDYLAAGAIAALYHEGVRIPEDVRLVALYNKGLGPVAWDSLACWELDSHAGGDIAAQRIVAWLDGDRRTPVECTIGTAFRNGATSMPPAGAKRAPSRARAGRRSSGQAMVEFVIAIFAIVLLVAGMADFIGAASRHSEIISRLRGRAGAAAISSSANDAGELVPAGSAPCPVLSEGGLAAHFVHKDEREDYPLSNALRKWLFHDALTSLSVGGEVWMPPLEIPAPDTGGAP